MKKAACYYTRRFFLRFFSMNLKMVDDADNEIFAPFVKIAEIHAEIEIYLGSQIQNHIESENDHAENQRENRQPHGPVGQTGILFPASPGGGENPEKGEKHAEKGGISAENGNDGHDRRGQGGKR